MTDPVRIAVTPGEPAGIGPDLCLQLAQQQQPAQLVAICDPALLRNRARQLGTDIQLHDFDPSQAPRLHVPGNLDVLPASLRSEVQAGTAQASNAAYVLDTLDLAVDGCEKKVFSAMVTGPVDKSIINAAGIPFTGHTEYLAERTKTKQVVMLLTAPGIRLALLTTHLPLSRVSGAITRERILDVLGVLAKGLLEDFGIPRPGMLVCGLNPHAGEGGHLGTEEREVIAPALDTLRDRGMQITGPVSADTAFTAAQLEKNDVIVAMYHDQGLPAFKHIGFGSAVNITLGLPVVRTSVDHGTAFDLAGTGNADTGSLQAAIDMAIEISAHRFSSTR